MAAQCGLEHQWSLCCDWRKEIKERASDTFHVQRDDGPETKPSSHHGFRHSALSLSL